MRNQDRGGAFEHRDHLAGVLGGQAKRADAQSSHVPPLNPLPVEVLVEDSQQTYRCESPRTAGDTANQLKIELSNVPVLKTFPDDLVPDDVAQCLGFSARLGDDRFIAVVRAEFDAFKQVKRPRPPTQFLLVPPTVFEFQRRASDAVE